MSTRTYQGEGATVLEERLQRQRAGGGNKGAGLQGGTQEGAETSGEVAWGPQAGPASSCPPP